jgi:uncharacterized protein (TIGR01777 family)
MRVFVTGATGLIGSALCRVLVGRGHAVIALSRSSAPRGLPAGVKVCQGDPAAAGRWEEELAACDACVHLAGESLVRRRWTEAQKRAIRASRVGSTRRVAEAIAARGPRVLISGSAIGYYGPRGDEPLDELAPAGQGFLASVCREWEEAARPAAARARVVELRTGIVLARGGGALQQMALPFRFFLGGPIGRGEFWVSWIHIADEVGLIAWALEDDGVVGPLDATAPEPVRQRDLARAIGRALGRPSVLPVPSLALRLALGEMADAVASGQRVLPRKALEGGYRFQYERLEPALADLLP